jgi:hypothetical protein
MTKLKSIRPPSLSGSIKLSNAIQEFIGAEKRSFLLMAKIDQTMQSEYPTKELELLRENSKTAQEDIHKWLDVIIHTKCESMRDVLQKLEVCADIAGYPDPMDEQHSPLERLIASVFFDMQDMLR